MDNSASRILVVEDERLVAEDLAASLENLGHIVVGITGSAKDAIKLTRDTGPDLVLMDIYLQDNMDGIEAAKVIRGKLGAPVLFLSAYSGENLVHRAKATDPCGYLLKPFTEKDLRVAIEMALYKAEMERRLRESEERYRTLVELAPEGIILHVQGKIILANRAASQILAANGPEDLVGKDLMDFVHPDFVQITLDRQDRMYANFESAPLLEEVFLRADGKPTHVEVASGFLTYGGKNAVQTLIRDINERKRAEAERERLIAKLKAIEEALRFQASRDDLTGLLNRRAILERLKMEMSRSSREGGDVGLIMLDIDNFKDINDRFGHQAGDSALKEVANRIMASVRPYDSVGRYGGEEFLVVAPGADLDAACIVADRLRKRFHENPIPIGNLALPLTVSLGVASSNRLSPKEIDSFIQAADQALYHAKRSGRNRVESHAMVDQMMHA
jgi:diguanylate cyclase (GGDEF)-like protein/PAS domain S-box-containing protein